MKSDERQLSLVLHHATPSKEPKLALHIPPPRSVLSSERRFDLAAGWASDLGELAAELVAEGKLGID
jgi:hypothetical protein